MFAYKPQENKPQGYDPYDQHYGVGYQIGVHEYSPFTRVNKARRDFLDAPFYVDTQRGCLVTEAYKKFEGYPQILKVAKAFEMVLENVDIQIYPDEMIVGEAAAPFKAAAVYPEFSYGWIKREMETVPFNKRERDIFQMKDGATEDFQKMTDFWPGKTIADAIDASWEYDEMKGTHLGKGVYMLSLYYQAGIGHLVADYEMLMASGFGKIRDNIQAKLAEFENGNKEDLEQRNFYKAELITVNAAINYIKRYAKLAAEMAEKEQDNKRKEELLRIAANCNQVAEGPARDFWEALQLWHMATDMILVESNGHSVSYGRMDQWMYPYYRASLDNNIHTKEFMQELLELAYIKSGSNTKLKPTSKIYNAGLAFAGECLTVGGVDKYGQDATNDLTFMMIDASAHTRLIVPWLCVRMHANTPYELKVKVAETIRAGFGHPKVYNDEAAILAALSKGLTLEEARDYAIVGCVEIDAPGKEYGWHDAAYFNISKVLELAINDGQCINCSDKCHMYTNCAGAGNKLGLSTGSLADFQSYEELWESFDRQLKYWIDLMVSGINVMDVAHQELKPLPYLSLLYPDCMENGQDIARGGAKYNFTGPQGNGFGTAVDGISALKQLVFEEKKYTGEDFLTALKNNWEGHEALYALVNSEKVHHYGNDNDFADEIAQDVFNAYCKYVDGRPNARGGKFNPGVYSVSANIGLGAVQGASPDGRKAGEAVSDNLSGVHTMASAHETKGPTAIANSVTKLDHSRASNGTLLNWKFSPECVSGDTGRENIMNLIDVYFQKKGMHSQFNIISKDTMIDAMENPENYKDMLVRVAGFSAYFVELSRPLQLDIIGRTDLSFE